MAKYPAVITTMAGTNTIAEANASKQALIFTKIVIGAGDMPASIPSATALTDKRLELAITKSVKTGDGQFMVQGLLSNKNLEAGFYAREIGLMAKAGENGQEVLFSYTNGGNYVDYIPDKNTPMDSYTFTITTVIGNAEKVQAIVSDNGLASAHDLNAIIQKVDNIITNVDTVEMLAKAPSLQLVKTLLSLLNIKNADDVIKAIVDKKESDLGIRYDFTNPNAWYICLGKLLGNFIIQGGNNLVRGNKEATITLPISYRKFFIPVSNPEYDSIHKFNINMVSMYSGMDGLNKVHLTTDVWGDSDVDKEIYCWWLTVGI
ncbi:phage tail-collar fiber domain-containing protein [Veillonella sp.]